MTLAPGIPRATYRMQLHREFTLAAARTQVPYLAQLGISHLYVSPILTARTGSRHGYDVVDHTAVSPELGGEQALRELVATLRAHNMGLIVDIVPNHMAVGGTDNRLWLDVLEWGRVSRYANFFDIDWDVPDPALKNKILAPFLGSPYGEALQAGELKLHFDGDSGRFHIDYFEHRFPVAPSTYPRLLRLGGGELTELAKTFRTALAEKKSGRGEMFASACLALAESSRTAAGPIATLLQRLDAGTATGRQLLHQLLERQHYRLAWWRTAADEINWRRFFDVIQLAGIRIQEPAAFEIVHATTFRLYAEGLIDGVRIDHIDGLADPRTYCRHLRKRLQQLAPLRPPSAPSGRAYIVVEKILAPEERLPGEWQVNGTTGYSFMNAVSALLHDPTGEPVLTKLWMELSGSSGDFESEAHRARRRILQELLAAEFNACAYALHRIARSDPSTRDWSLLAIRRVLEELLVQFPIYRTYVDGRGRSAADTKIMRGAIDAARPFCRSEDQALLDLINRWLGAESPQRAATPRARQAQLRAITRFQQLSSPLAAKSVEDTAFYRHGKLLSRNEVGANPAQFANSPQDFHAESQHRAEHFPHALLATATHDHKRGEDLRARLAVLSECGERWAARAHRWISLNAKHKNPQQPWPLIADEYMLYQMLVGGWPLDLKPYDPVGLRDLCERLQQWWQKALREAKQISSWATPNRDYESACAQFLTHLLDPAFSQGFIDDLAAFALSIAPAGAVNGISQTLLKLTSPGIPDIYQGGELWDFSFVDPDNRRPVDYTHRRRLLESKTTNALQDWQSGAIKQQIIQRTLHVRRDYPELFARGQYKPLVATGELANHVFAFERRWRKQRLIVATLRLPTDLVCGNRILPASTGWGDTAVVLTESHFSQAMAGKTDKKKWHSVMGDRPMISAEKFFCAELFADFPCALLLSS